MQGLILAAGMGKRLKALTADDTKCMVKVNGVPLIDRMLGQLDGLDLERIVIVVGYKADRLIEHIQGLDVVTPIVYVENPDYASTNNIFSLGLAADELAADDTILLESDLIFEDGVLEDLVADPRPTLALVDAYQSWMDGTVVTLDEDDHITSFVPGKQMDFSHTQGYFKTVNVYKFARDFSKDVYVPFLKAYMHALGVNEYYEQVLRVITMVDSTEVQGKRMEGRHWYEIDDLQDLDIAESIFAPTPGERLAKIAGRYGGYWRYPELLDFCYLVNPYYPTARLKSEMKASFDALLGDYPSGMRVNSLLAAKTFGIDQGKIVVGNGAAELIRDLMARFTGKVGFIRPTFEEYPNRCDESRSVVYVPRGENFAYGAEELEEFFEGEGLEALVLVNPDNPTGNYLPKTEVEELCAWCEERGIALVLDESFVDFASEEGASLLADELLERHPQLIVVKSISKSHGVPGVRLGVAASANEGLIAELKRDAAIWNINSFGEFYLQIAEKYKADYQRSLALVRKERARLFDALLATGGLRPIPSEANFIMCEVAGPLNSTELTSRLLAEDAIFIKDLSPKMGGGSFIRVAVRDEADDDRLLRALERVLGEA